MKKWPVLLALLVLFQAPAFSSGKGEKKAKKPKNNPETHLAKARTLYEQGRFEKASRAYEVAARLSRKTCLECLLGLFRSAVAVDSFDEAARYAGAVMDVAEVEEAEEVEEVEESDESDKSDESDESDESEGAGEVLGMGVEAVEQTEEAEKVEETEEADPRKVTLSEEQVTALLDEIEGVFRRALAATEGSDADVLWGLIDVLGRRGRGGEIVQLAERHLDTAEEKSLICAADSRPSLKNLTALPVGDEINEQLRARGWDGPWLVASRVRRPRERRFVSTAGSWGAQMSGVVDGRGFLQDVRVRRPLPVKLPGDVRDKLRRSTFDPATYRGQRIAVCLPFTVALPGMARPVVAEKKAGAGQASEAEAVAELDIPESKKRASSMNPVYVEGNVKAPEKIHGPQPQYNEIARRARVQGVVIARLVITEYGDVAEVEVLQGLTEGLDEAAVEAFKKWKFRPATVDGEPVAVYYNLTANFRLQ